MKTNQNFYTGRSLPLLLAMIFAGILTSNAQPTDKWLGNVSTAWSNSSNWSTGAVPTSGVDVIIDNGNYTGGMYDPTLDASGLVCGTLSVNNAAILTGASGTSLTISGSLNGTGEIDAGPSTIYIHGDMTVNTFNYGTSTVIENGSAQAINIPYQFYNLIIFSGITTVASSGIVIHGTLTVDAGATLMPLPGNTISGSGTLTGAGTIDVTNTTTLVDNLGSQYGTSTLTLTNLTVNYIGTAAQQIGSSIQVFGSVEIGNKHGVTAVNNVGTPIVLGHNLILDSGTFNASNKTIDVAGNITGTGSVFNAQTSNVILDGTSSQNITGMTFYNLKLNNSSGAVLTGSDIVNDTLTLTSGLLTLGTNNLTITTSTGLIQGYSSASYVQTNSSGVLVMNANHTGGTVYPIGDDYNPITIFPTTDAVFDARVANGITDSSGNAITHDAVNVTWMVQLVTGSQNVAVMVQWNGSQELTGFSTDRNNSYVIFRTSQAPNTPAAIWTPSSTAGAAAGSDPYTRTSGNIAMSASAPDFIGVADNALPLPVSLVSFTAQYQDGHVNLNWATASEQNNAYFEIERSIDAASWESIGQVPGHGTTDVYNSYASIDNLEGVAPSGTFYYRLKQMDFNGAFAYSMIRSVDISNPAATVSTYPNPTSSILNVNWTSSSENNTTLRLINVTGVSVYEQTFAGIGAIQKQIDMSTLADGVYYLQIISGNNNTVSKAVYKN